MPAHPLVRLAADAIQLFLASREHLIPPESIFLTLPEARQKGSAFVCLKLNGELRGCIGSIDPAQESLALEIVHNAIASACRDPRFPPVQQWEADLLDITVDILGPFEPIEHEKAAPDVLDPRVFGVLVRAGERQGVLLPDLDEVVTPADQIAIARDKAGIGADEQIALFRFTVTRYR